MTEPTPAREEREYPKELVERLSGLIRTSGAMTTGKRARRILDAIFDYGEEAAEKVAALAGALGLAEETVQAEATVPPTPLSVKAEVEIPLGTVQEAIDTLSRVPWDARLGMSFSGMPEHDGRGYITSDDRYRPRITARWNEER